MTVPSTDRDRASAPGARAGASTGTSAPATGPGGLPQRAPRLPVRPRNRVPLDTLEATFAGLQQIDENARPAQPLAPPPELWPPAETGSHPLVTRSPQPE